MRLTGCSPAGIGRVLPAVLVILAASVMMTTGTDPAGAGAFAAAAVQSHSTVAFKSSLPATPTYNGDAGDPDVIESAGTYYAFTTGTALGNHIQALVDTSGSPQSGWRSYTGQTYGSTGLPAM